MSASREPRRAAWWDSGRVVAVVRVCVVLLAAFVCFRFGRYTLARPLALTDDEGYVLLTLKHYLAGEHLYTQVFSQYGPFYFLVQKAIFRGLHLAVSYDAGRQVMLGYWLVGSALGGVFVYRVSRSVTLGAAGALAVMWLERVMAHEPGHPEQMVLVLMMAGCVVAMRLSRGSAVGLGVVGAALFWTKTNVGVFFVAAVLIAVVCVLPDGRLRRVGRILLVACAVVGTAVLMRDFFVMWAWRFCLLSVMATTATIVAGTYARVYAPAGLRALRWFALGVGAGVVLIAAGAEVAGIPFRGVVDSVVVGAARQTTVFELPIGPHMATLLTAIVLFSVLAVVYRRMGRPEFAVWGDVAKCVAGGLAIALLVVRGDVQGPAGFAMLYVVLPLVLLPRKGRAWEAAEFFPRIFVAALAAMELLQAYPVAGSQLNVGAAPLLLWGFVCVCDGVGGLSERRRGAVSGIGVVAAAAVILLMFRTGRLQAAYAFPRSALAGSSSLRLPPELEAHLERLSEDVRANCDVLFTMPGMGGFNFWSGVRTPDGFNEDNWMRGVPLGEQQQTLEELRRDPQACVIVRPDMLGDKGGWGMPDGGLDTLPLARYIRHDMPVVFREQGGWGLEIRVSPERRAPWVERSGR